MRQTIRSLERLKLPRYQVMAYELLTSLLLDLDLNQQAFETSERGLARRRFRKIKFWRVRSEATNAIVRMRLGDLEVGPALNGTLAAHARTTSEARWFAVSRAWRAGATARRARCLQCARPEMLALAEGAGMKELAARAHRWRGEALAAVGKRDSALEQLALAAEAAEKIGRVRLVSDATEALAKVSGDPAHHARAAALAARIEHSARECQQLMAAE